MKMSEIRELSDEQLVHKELELERTLIDARFKKQFNTLEDSSIFSKIRKDIARLQTEQSRRQAEQSLPNNGLKMLHAKTFKPSAAEDTEGTQDFLKNLADKMS